MLGPTLRAVPARATYITSSAQSGSSTTYTFTGINIGTAYPDRVIIIAAMMVAGSGLTTSISGLTVGGAAATKIVGADAAGSQAAIFIYRLSTGTTATIVATNTGTMTGAGVSVYSATGMKKFAGDTTNSYITTKSASSLNLTGTQAGFAIGVASDDVSTGLAWTGLTSNYAAVLGLSGSWGSTALTNFTTSGTKSISAAFSGGTGAVSSFATAYFI